MKRIVLILLSVVLSAYSFAQDNNGHQYVDMGLSVKWATCNIGASAPEEFGSYFAWGEPKRKSSYLRENYKYQDNPETLPLTQDAAHVSWGGSWRMPTRAEFDELKTKCTWVWKENYNGKKVNGYLVTSKTTKNSIFLPAAGFMDDNELYDDNSYGLYWSSSRDPKEKLYAYYLNLHNDRVEWINYIRCPGQSVRAVCK